MAEAGRVIAGAAKGVRLLAPPAATRPLTDRVKQSLFAALLADGVVGEGRVFLDLFAGSGAAGIEALSLGCERAVLVERDAAAATTIGRNLERVRLAGGTLVRGDALRFLGGSAADGGGPFDACLADPPYGDPVLAAAIGRLGDPAAGWLTDDAVVVAKHFWRDALPERAGGLEHERQRRFGETMLTFYRYRL